MIRIYLDANILITAFEDKSSANGLVWRVLNEIDSGMIEAVTSQITLAEVIPKPLANAQLDLVEIYEDLLSSRSFLDVWPVTAETLSAAARIRAERLSIKLPDAIHLATARRAACHAIFTSDKRLAIPHGTPAVAPSPSSLGDLQAIAR